MPQLSSPCECNSSICRVAESRLTTIFGEFLLIAYRSVAEPGDHLALIKGDFPLSEPVLVRVHSQCLTGEILGSLQCDCGDQLQQALNALKQEGSGILLYLPQEGRGIGLADPCLCLARKGTRHGGSQY